MRHAVVLLSIVAAGCIDFDARLAECDAGRGLCAPDATGGGMPDASIASDGGPYLGPLGFCVDGGFCWVHPRPFGEPLSAIDGTSMEDLWVVGTAGLVAHWDGTRWTDRRVPNLGAIDAAEVTTVVANDAGVWIAGDGLAPHRASGAGWVREAYVQNAPSYLVRSIAQMREVQGALVAVGSRTDQQLLLVSRGADGTWRELDAGLVADGTALLGGSELMIGVHQGGSNGLWCPGGGLMPAPSTDLYTPGVRALWREPGAGVWAAGAGCLLDLLDAGSFEGVSSPCAAGWSVFRAGRWVAGLGTNVVVGSGGAILEGQRGAFIAPSQEWLPGGQPGFSDVWVDEQGRGVVVSDSAVIARRDPSSGDWRSVGADMGIAQDLRQDFSGLAARGDRLWVAGPMSMEARVGLGDGHLAPLGPNVVGDDHQVFALWLDEQGQLYSVESSYDSEGRLCRVASDGSCEVIAAQPKPLWGLWAPSPGDLLAVGAAGSVIRLRDGRVTQMLPDGGSADLYDVVRSSGHTYAASWDAQRSAATVFEVGEDLSLSPVYGPIASKGFLALAAAPTGELWAMGGSDLIARREVDGGWRQEALPTARTTSLTGAFAFAADDAWACGTAGVVYHFDGVRWRYVESGTRLNLHKVVGREVGGQREVWVSGDNGALLLLRHPRP